MRRFAVSPQGIDVHAPSAGPSAPVLRWPRAIKILNCVLLLATFLFFALHFLHLSADFPNFSRWTDWSKYTDEGWYGDAAIRHFQLGHWYVAGDFNPAVALPIWPLMETAVFAFTGVSLIAVRALTVAVFGGVLFTSWLLLARSGMETPRARDREALPVFIFQTPHSLAASVAVLLLAANPFCFVFTRVAILEPLLILVTLVALLAAQAAHPLQKDASWHEAIRANLRTILPLGVLLPVLILTKTTGLFLVPAVAWMLFACLGFSLRRCIQVGFAVAALALALWSIYFLLLVRPHYLVDYRYLFSANGYTRISRANYASVLTKTFKDGRWLGTTLWLAAAFSAMAALIQWVRLRSRALVPALLLWATGYMTFLAYHNNLQPRYYLVVAVPVTLLLPAVFVDLVWFRLPSRRTLISGLFAAAVVCLLIVIPDAIQSIRIARHPQYTLLSAARQVHDYIALDRQQHPDQSDLVLSISGSEISLMTGLHSICDDFGTLELADRAKLYNPGWYASWNLIEDDKMDALGGLYRVVRVATFPAMDDPDRNLLVLYRLNPLNEQLPSHAERRKRSRTGQQPRPVQSEH